MYLGCISCSCCWLLVQVMDQHPKRSLRRRKNVKDVQKKLRKRSSQPSGISAVTLRTAERIILALNTSNSNKRRSEQVGSLATSCVTTPPACDTHRISSTGSFSLQESSQIICHGIDIFKKCFTEQLNWCIINVLSQHPRIRTHCVHSSIHRSFLHPSVSRLIQVQPASRWVRWRWSHIRTPGRNWKSSRRQLPTKCLWVDSIIL